MEGWRRAGYAQPLIASLEAGRSYAIVDLGRAQFAFSDYDCFVVALKAAWRSGLAPDHGPGPVLGIDLPEVAPSLEGVNSLERLESWLERDGV